MARRRRRRNEGSVFFSKSDGAWIARFPLGVRDGRRVGKKVRCHSEAFAKAELERMRRALAADVDPAGGSLDRYLAAWLADHGPSVRPSTRTSYEGHVRMHISPLLGGIPVAKLRTSDVRRLLADRIAAGLSPATVHRIHSTLRAALAQGVKDRTLVDNAALGVDLPRVERRPVRAMTDEDADAIREAVRGTFLDSLVELLLGSALRLGEALGLDQQDVNIDERFVVVRRTKTRIRSVEISDDAAESLRMHIARLKRRGAAEPVFVAPRTKHRLSTATVSHAFPRMLVAAGLDRVTPHGLRHGAASILLEHGASLKDVQEQLGHATIHVTANTYAHLTSERRRKTVRLLNRKREAS